MKSKSLFLVLPFLTIILGCKSNNSFKLNEKTKYSDLTAELAKGNFRWESKSIFDGETRTTQYDYDLKNQLFKVTGFIEDSNEVYYCYKLIRNNMFVSVSASETDGKLVIDETFVDYRIESTDHVDFWDSYIDDPSFMPKKQDMTSETMPDSISYICWSLLHEQLCADEQDLIIINPNYGKLNRQWTNFSLSFVNNKLIFHQECVYPDYSQIEEISFYNIGTVKIIIPKQINEVINQHL